MQISPQHIEELASAIEAEGRKYGMELHWGKTQALAVDSFTQLRAPNGDLIEDRDCLIYLGSLLSSDGTFESELCRRIGTAAGDFKQLQAVWGHAGLSRRCKLQLFDSLVVCRLKYGLSVPWLLSAQRRRLDGFYVRCLRKVLGIPLRIIHAFRTRWFCRRQVHAPC